VGASTAQWRRGVGYGERLRRLVPGVWAGLLLGIAIFATPAPFAVLSTADAGRVVARIFALEVWVSLGLALLLIVVERQRARSAAAAGVGSVLSAELLLLFGVVFCSVAGYYGVRPLMPAARTGQGPLSFGQLHALSTLLFGVKTIVVVALAWRTTDARFPAGADDALDPRVHRSPSAAEQGSSALRGSSADRGSPPNRGPSS
jgi:hypothetical protein